MDRAEKRLAGLTALLTDAHRRLGLEFGFRLWNGARIPADWPADALTIAIADEGAVAGLARAPRLTTLANLWAARRLDIVNGTLFDLAARRPKARSRALLKSLAHAAPRFGSGCRSWSRRAAVRGRSRNRPGSGKRREPGRE